jgi:ABC-type multidrug transport system fused ATPase/permease subunit
MFIEIGITTPALLFSTVSLLYIGYTNRFMSIANLVRGLKDKFLETHDADLLKQIANLRRRIILIRNMQLLGIAALIVSVFSIIALYSKYQNIGEMLFFISLILLILSMMAAVQEIFISVDALTIELSSIEELKEDLEERGILNRIFHSDEKKTRE